MLNKIEFLPYTTTNSHDLSIAVIQDNNCNCSEYRILNYDGLDSYGNVKFKADNYQTLKFRYKDIGGVLSEQIMYILRDRVLKLGAIEPHEYTADMLKGIDMFLEAYRKKMNNN